MSQEKEKFEQVPLSDVPRESARPESSSARQNGKHEPYATGLNAEKHPNAVWAVFCKHCKQRFTPKQQPPQYALDRAQKVWLRCPHCSDLEKYTPADLLSNTQDSSGGNSNSTD